MKKRTLGKTGVEISEVGLGTWQLGSADWGVVDENDALAILRTAVETGVNLLDTADVYGLGVSEQVIGKFLKDTQETVHVATKLGRVYCVETGGWPEKFTLDMARKATQQSIKNLGVDSIFLQQWHCVPTEMMRDGHVFDILETIKKEGLIQHWGCSVETVEEAHICMAHPGCASLQVIYNIFRQRLTDEVLPMAKQNNVGILARVPLASGLLSGKFKKDHKFDESDHRNYNQGGKAFNAGETFAGVPFDTGVECVEEIRQILSGIDGASLAQLALRWILDHDGVSTVIPGATKLDHARSNSGASDLAPLGDDIHQKLQALYDEKVAGCIMGAY